jgi:hypothetical protein
METLAQLRPEFAGAERLNHGGVIEPRGTVNPRAHTHIPRGYIITRSLMTR